MNNPEIYYVIKPTDKLSRVCEVHCEISENITNLGIESK